MFRPVPPDPDFIALETEELARWVNTGCSSARSRSAGAEPWVFYEGPPTANGRPGLHHVWARVYKDLFCRYRTMRGYAVPRKAGWDTHGLPVEVEVEKQLGITDKRQIEEEVGIAEFTRLCRQSVRNYVDEWTVLTDRIGYWIDIDNAYWTFSPEYVEAVWWNLKCLWDQGLLYEDIKVVPYCPRCGTALSSHELGQPDVYRDVVDESAYVRFPCSMTARPPPGCGRRSAGPRCPVFAAGLDHHAVDAAVQHRRGGRDPTSTTPWSTTWWPPIGWGGRRARARWSGSGCRDEIWSGSITSAPSTMSTVRPAVGGDGWRVVAGAFVEADEGTGVVHLAPAFGEVDRETGRENDLPTLNPVGPDGRFTDAVSWLAGQSVRDTNAAVNDRLEAAGLLFRRRPTSIPIPTAGGATRPSSTGASPAGTSAPPPARQAWSNRTRPSAGTPGTSVTAGWGSGWPTTWTGRSPATGTGAPLSRCGGAGWATFAAWDRWPNSPSWPDGTSPTSTPTARPSTR